jgi:hypothetical protein
MADRIFLRCRSGSLSSGLYNLYAKALLTALLKHFFMLTTLTALCVSRPVLDRICSFGVRLRLREFSPLMSHIRALLTVESSKDIP